MGTFGSPYHGNSAEHAAWMRGYDDRRAVRRFCSGPAAQRASVTLAYNLGWRAGGPDYAERSHERAEANDAAQQED